MSTYHRFLCDKVDNEDNICKEYSNLLWEMDTVAFVPILPRDKNRIEDVRGLVEEFGWTWGETYGPSVLEVLVALAIRMDFQISEEPDGSEVSHCFWLMVDNLGLMTYTNEYCNTYHEEKPLDEVDDILNIWVDRKFEFDGKGSPFPLKEVCGDQRNLEIWYQMQAYILENYFNGI